MPFAAFCRLLRRSPHCALSRIQKEYRLPDEVIVLVLYVCAAQSGVISVPADQRGGADRLRVPSAASHQRDQHTHATPRMGKTVRGQR